MVFKTCDYFGSLYDQKLLYHFQVARQQPAVEEQEQQVLQQNLVADLGVEGEAELTTSVMAAVALFVFVCGVGIYLLARSVGPHIHPLQYILLPHPMITPLNTPSHSSRSAS